MSALVHTSTIETFYTVNNYKNLPRRKQKVESSLAINEVDDYLHPLLLSYHCYISQTSDLALQHQSSQDLQKTWNIPAKDGNN